MSRSMSLQSTNLISSSTGTTSKNLSRKRKVSSAVYQEAHGQIEKRRRNKMNSFTDELASLMPTCNTDSRKLNKLSVLHMAVQHIKNLQSERNYDFYSSTAKLYTDVHHKPAFLSDEELKHLILRAADGFLFVVDCDQGKIQFVSESVDNILNYSKNELIGQSLFNYLHPKDIAKVKEQLSSADITPQKRLLNAKTDQMGFCTIHSTGFLKSWSPTEVDLGEKNKLDSNGCNLSCLVAVGRLHHHTVSWPVQNDVKVKPMEFVSRHAVDGKFVFVDPRATAILSYLPQELLENSFYEYFHEDDIAHLAKCHWQDAGEADLHGPQCLAFLVVQGKELGRLGNECRSTTIY
ncbi:hypothetical protein PAMA_000487 [Pampus argenteus]